jgi:ABC-2 type transport system permease protein
MYRFFSSVKKEYLLLVSDRVGLLFMFVMPLVLVVLLTAVQDSAFRRINENRISLLLISHDAGKPAQQLIDLMKESGFFNIEQENSISEHDIKAQLISRKKLAAVYIPEDFSEKLLAKAEHVSSLMLSDMMLVSRPEDDLQIPMPDIAYYHDPILQESFNYTIINILYSYMNIVENSLMLDVVYEQMGFEDEPQDFRGVMMENRVNISQIPASAANIIPNTTQHNVPAWTIFAMFFMVVSLGSNIVRERTNGSFIRLKTMPVNFTLVFGSKMFVYVLVAILQVIVIFSVGVFLFPAIQLPSLILPSNPFMLLFVVLVTAISAVSYAMMIGSLARTQEQANGVGAVSIIIFAALGGILVPVFIMPGFLKMISIFSPLYWCLEGFYLLFLKGGKFLSLLGNMVPLFAFIIICQTITYFSLKKERII